ncbi:hypothetical protein BGZ96_003932 [Linnemannia gamsii]|uniref:Uncharacterized protein n=1 Tax=Linnemannia gamsii TaxID=64522 RepID=A0ABQ7KGX4_9FUNG|nr:hypothetical protein BGZ96_003932 [Linnemannia gamsii]
MSTPYPGRSYSNTNANDNDIVINDYHPSTAYEFDYHVLFNHHHILSNHHHNLLLYHHHNLLPSHHHHNNNNKITRATRYTGLIVNPTPTKVNGQDGSGGGLPTAAIIGIAAAAVIIIGFVSTVLVMKHKKHVRRQKELDPNELFGNFHSPPSLSPLAHPVSSHHSNKHHHHLNDDQYPDNGYDQGGANQPETQQLYHNSDYHHNGHHDGGHYDHGHHGGDHNGYDHGGDGQDGGVNQAHSHYDPASGGGQAQSNVYNDPSGGGHQAIGNDGAVGNQYAPNGGGGSGGDFQGVGQGVSDTGNYDYGVGQGQNVGGIDQGGNNFYDGYGGGQETGFGHGGNDFGGYGQGQVDPSSGYGGNGVGGGGNNIGVAGSGTGGFDTGYGIGGGAGSPPLIPQGGAGGWGAPLSFGAVPPPVPLIPNRNSSNRVSVNPENTSAQVEYALLDLTAVPAPKGTSSTSYRPLDRFESNASRSTHYSSSGAGSMSPQSPPMPARPGSSTIKSWDDSTQEFRQDRPLSTTSIASSTTAGPYGQHYQSLGSPTMYQDFIPPPTSRKPSSPMIASILPATTSTSFNTGTRRSVGAPQDRGPDMPSVSGGQASDLNAFERRAPQTNQENVQNPDSLYNVVASTLRQPQGGI